METILSKIISKARAAMLARIPFIYIKTGCHEFIREIVDSDGQIVQIIKNEKGIPENWEDYRGDLKSQKFDLNTELWNEPHIITVSMDLFDQEFRNNDTFAKFLYVLDTYVRNYYNPYYEKRDYLHGSAFILYSEKIRIPESFLQYTEVIEVGYPKEDEIHDIILDMAEEYGEDGSLNQDAMDWLYSEFAGFRQNEIRYAMRKILTRELPETEPGFLTEESRLYDTREIKKIIRERKQQKMQGIEVLKLISVDEDHEIGGMKQLTGWIHRISSMRLLENIKSHREERGIQAPKGILVCGIPGCGKSLAAKAAAKTFGLPLLQMDVGNLMTGIQGESEENMRKALALAEAMSPCVLWIDELEKGFSEASGNSATDNGTFKRMFGTMLNWMQENTKPCFIFATANDIGGLPKEFFRSGRFDELFALFLPTAEECADIFVKHVSAAAETTSEKRAEKGMKNLFESDCMKEDFYLNIMNSLFVKQNGEPRIVIGSDIQKIVNYALTELSRKMTNPKSSISRYEWQPALTEAINNCSVYGDGAENIDSIAVSYCRMLRKSMKPTADKSQVLFRSSEYHAENFDVKKESSKKKDILEKRSKNEVQKLCLYDKAVYQFLSNKINEIAPDVEKNEKENLIGGTILWDLKK